MILTPMSAISPTTRRMTDSELMVAVRDGNGEALDTLFHRYARLVYRIAADILKDRAEAEDSTQEVFLEIYRKAHLYDPERGSVRGWLVQYAYRRTLRRKSVLTRRAAYGGEPLETVAELRQLPPSLSRDECRWVLRSGLAHLPEKQRTTLELACFEGLSLRDVAGRLGVSLGCTRHYYYRGLARLQQWARLTGSARATRCHTAARGDRAGAGSAPAMRPYDRV